jgi:RNA polymerase I-specific transcription initiation factor RRN6
MIDVLGRNESNETPLEVTIQAVKCSFFEGNELHEQINQNPLTVSAIYDRLVDVWVTCLPRRTPGPVRLAKDRLVRSIATELYLSSVAVSIRDKSVPMPAPEKPQESLPFVLPVREKGVNVSAAQSLSGPTTRSKMTSLVNASVPDIGIMSPDPIQPVSATVATDAPIEQTEDDAISRLRGYALSARSLPPLGVIRSSILKHWPAIPGASPFEYSWEDMRKNALTDDGLDSDEEEASIRQKEEERRQKRKEKFLKRERAVTLETGPQSIPMVSGSQPDPVQPFLSSQPLDPEVPMTQPDRGTFGSRLIKHGSKRRRTRGF